REVTTHVPAQTALSGKDEDSAAVQDTLPDAEPESVDAFATKEDEDAIRVYLTFDDGPSANTEAILDILDRYQVKATFFVVGKSEDYTPLYQRIVRDGHTLGMHSYSHRYSEIYAGVEPFLEDVHRLSDMLFERTGVRSTIYRFPGGSSNTVSSVDMTELISALEKEGISYYDWNVSGYDADGKTSSVSDIVSNVTENIAGKENAIVLLHDANDKTTTVEALPIIIEKLQSMEHVSILPITEDTVKIQHISIE
ncbi:MAG: polysaccharide deacetylase, partial [Lachnospiraceae bacterium]|nr:polysaccharide deacetylase [Lachnospiraceae bacterium]